MFIEIVCLFADGWCVAWQAMAALGEERAFLTDTTQKLDTSLEERERLLAEVAEAKEKVRARVSARSTFHTTTPCEVDEESAERSRQTCVVGREQLAKFPIAKKDRYRSLSPAQI